MLYYFGKDDCKGSVKSVQKQEYFRKAFRDYETKRGGLRPIAPSEKQAIYDMLQGIDKRENDFTNDVKDMPYEKFSEWCGLQYEYAN